MKLILIVYFIEPSMPDTLLFQHINDIQYIKVINEILHSIFFTKSLIPDVYYTFIKHIHLDQL